MAATPSTLSNPSFDDRGRWWVHPVQQMLSPLEMVRFTAAVLWSVAVLAVRPVTWAGTVRDIFSRQIYFTGIGGLPVTCVAGLTVGVSVITQAGLWLERLDQSDLFGPLVGNVVIQNLGPLLVNFFVIARSGTAIATELANMAVHHEVEVIDAQGVDPFAYLVLPRVLGVAVSVLGLTIVFITVALLGGYLFGVALQMPSLANGQFANGIFQSLRPLNMVQLLIKTVVPGLVSGAICCVYGLRVEPVLTAVPQAGTRAAVASIWTLFILSAVVTFASGI